MPSVETIYDNTLDPATLNSSTFFQDATMIWMETPDLPPDLELEIDCALQIFLSPTEQRQVNLGTPILTNQINTVSVIPIPLEYQGLGYNQQLLLISTISTRAIVRAIIPDNPNKDEFDQIQQRFNDLEGKIDAILLQV